MKRDKIIYWIFTGLLSLWMLFHGFMFITNSNQFTAMFEDLGVPASLIIPNGIAKILAVIAILTKKSQILKKLAYYGLGLDFISAIVLHLIAGDGRWPTALVALVILIVSFYYDRKLFSISENKVSG